MHRYPTDRTDRQGPHSGVSQRHGGCLLAASRRYGIPPAEWLDISTGISPWAYPVPDIPASIWQRLPEDDDALLDAARAYYGVGSLCVTAGTQAAIQALPRLRRPGRVAVPVPGYAEHARAWICGGHDVERYASVDAVISLSRIVDVLVVINPNNPSGTRITRPALLECQSELARRGGWLVVDEAFMDPTPGDSLLPIADRPGLIILRSVGKFFGLAGARVGFVSADAAIAARLAAVLGPWPVAGPARWVVAQALRDKAWQAENRRRLQQHAERLAGLLRSHDLAPSGGCALFQWVLTQHAQEIGVGLARQGVLVRQFTEPCSLRFGLVTTAAEYARLDAALVRARTQPCPSARA